MVIGFCSTKDVLLTKSPVD